MQHKSRFMMLLVGLAFALIFAGCTPVAEMDNVSMPGGDVSAAADDGAETDDAMMDDGSAVATIATRSLRVRGEPNEAAEVVAGVREGETYKVVKLSDDGQWVQLAIASAPEGNGWVSANFVSVEGELGGMADEAMSEDADEDAAMEEPAEDAAMEAAIPDAPGAGLALIFTDGTRLRVRAEPSTDAEIAGYVYNGEIYPAISLSDDNTWVQIGGSAEGDNPDGGWISAEFTVIGE